VERSAMGRQIDRHEEHAMTIEQADLDA